MSEQKCTYGDLLIIAQSDASLLSPEQWQRLQQHLHQWPPCRECLRRMKLNQVALTFIAGSGLVRDQAEAVDHQLEVRQPEADLASAQGLRLVPGDAVDAVGDDEIDEIDETADAGIAMAADDATVARTPSGKVKFFPLGDVPIDGVQRELLTDGRRVAVRLHPGERHAALSIDDERLEIQITAGGSMAVLAGYARADAALLLTDVQGDPGTHVLRWESPAAGTSGVAEGS